MIGRRRNLQRRDRGAHSGYLRYGGNRLVIVLAAHGGAVGVGGNNDMTEEVGETNEERK